ncbi:MAG: hypothetical protein ACR65R_11940 [Methylomicrobium sp.]
MFQCFPDIFFDSLAVRLFSGRHGVLDSLLQMVFFQIDSERA